MPSGHEMSLLIRGRRLAQRKALKPKVKVALIRQMTTEDARRVASAIDLLEAPVGLSPEQRHVWETVEQMA